MPRRIYSIDCHQRESQLSRRQKHVSLHSGTGPPWSCSSAKGSQGQQLGKSRETPDSGLLGGDATEQPPEKGPQLSVLGEAVSAWAIRRLSGSPTRGLECAFSWFASLCIVFPCSALRFIKPRSPLACTGSFKELVRHLRVPISGSGPEGVSAVQLARGLKQYVRTAHQMVSTGDGLMPWPFGSIYIGATEILHWVWRATGTLVRPPLLAA